jgi:hypothetical protein
MSVGRGWKIGILDVLVMSLPTLYSSQCDVIDCSIRIRGRAIQSGADFMLVGRRYGLIIRDWRINGE